MGNLMVFVLAPWFTAGCAKDEVGPLVPVKGTVTIDGQPLTTGSVVLQPDTSKGNSTAHEPRGEIDGDGNYVVMTAGRTGAPAGWYRVSVVSQLSTATEKDPYAAPKSNIAAAFNNPSTSRLGFEVKAGAVPGEYDLKVTK